MKRSRGNKFADVFYTIKKIVLVLLISVGILGVLVFGANTLVVRLGESSLRKGMKGKTPNLMLEASGTEAGEDSDAASGTDTTDGTGQEPSDKGTTWQEGWIRYDGKIYAYKEDILTFLLLGIDQQGTVKESKNLTDGGQADAIFLLVADPEEAKISLIGVNRDTIVNVVMKGIGENGQDVVFPSQIAVQHGFGDGLEESCELTEDRVSELFFDLPIHAYASFQLGGIGALNDALGGVEVVIPEDLTKKNKAWTAGTTVTLKGSAARDFVQWRDTTVFESARGRLNRQKLYVNAFLKKAIDRTKKDITTPITLYNTFKDYIVTDLGIEEITYLAEELSGYSFNGDIYTLEGETRMKGEHEGFYPDEDALKDLIIKVFYKEVSVD